MVGAGDLSLNVSHPRQVLDQDRIVSSHTDPALWVELPEYADYVKFSSIRNPPGILNSACFSLNAQTSEYIQRFLPKDKDNDEIRLTLGVYKLTDLTFFEGLADFLKTYFDQFMPVRDRFHIMRWEDLITDPVPTIKAMGQAISLDVADPVCAGIWAKLDHVNLTGHHKHNYRAGKGIVGDWQRSLTNHHLEIVRKKGLEPVMKEFGYGPIQYLDESQYTDYQKEIDDCIRHGEVRDRTSDRDLLASPSTRATSTRTSSSSAASPGRPIRSSSAPASVTSPWSRRSGRLPRTRRAGSMPCSTRSCAATSTSPAQPTPRSTGWRRSSREASTRPATATSPSR